MALDSLGSSHPLYVPVHHPSEIGQIFDQISYAKVTLKRINQGNMQLGADHLITGGGGGGVEENVPEHFIYFFQEQRNFFYLTRSEKQFIFLYNKIGSNFVSHFSHWTYWWSL